MSDWADEIAERIYLDDWGTLSVLAIAAALREAEQRGAERMREEAAEVPSEWLKQYIDVDIKFTSAREHASCAAADIRDVIRALPLTAKPTEYGCGINHLPGCPEPLLPCTCVVPPAR